MIIFNEVSSAQTAVYTVRGCEKTIIVRGTAGEVFNLDIDTESASDPHERHLIVQTVTSSQDICINTGFPCFHCGMRIFFRTDSTISPNAHLFVEILDDTCVPKPCCDCAPESS